MSLVEQQYDHARDPPLLHLVINKPPSSSPFPSPSSSFLPPPRQHAHEFASKPPAEPRPTAKLTNQNKQILSAQPTPSLPNSVRSPTREPLASSRPAPPSPSVSRRPSQKSVAPSSKRQSRIQSNSRSQRRSLVNPVKIRDFGFPETDGRYLGHGPDQPKANRHRPRSRASDGGWEDYNGEEDVDFEEGEKRNSGWGGFVWAGLTNRLSWSFSGKREDADGGASKTDFERNFDMSSPIDEKHPRPDDDDDEEELEDDDEDGGEESPLVPGKYRAMFAFKPEGTAEMALEEEQIVNVVGRGGGPGWAVVLREDGRNAIIPESYIELMDATEQ